MKLYLIKQNANDDYYTYDSAVVVAESENAARHMHPNEYTWDGETWLYHSGRAQHTMARDWTSPDNVTVTEIGEASDGITGVVCASYNAG